MNFRFWIGSLLRLPLIIFTTIFSNHSTQHSAHICLFTVKFNDNFVTRFRSSWMFKMQSDRVKISSSNASQLQNAILSFSFTRNVRDKPIFIIYHQIFLPVTFIYSNQRTLCIKAWIYNISPTHKMLYVRIFGFRCAGNVVYLPPT